ncbi:MAG: hypothetical protein QXP38_13325 [Nitrososphaerota archaeon]
MSEPKETLKKKILEEMTVNHTANLEKNFDLAKQFIRITKEGKVDVLVKDRVSGKEQIMLYLIGKIYAKEAGLAETDEVGNDELMKELGIPVGSLLPWLKELRDMNKIRQIRREKKVYHTVPINQIEDVLTALERKVKKGL